MARELDRLRSFGEIYGGTGDARFEQDGIQFDSAGVELPGFENVEIVAAAPVVNMPGDDSMLRDEISRLNRAVGKLSGDLEEKDAAYEEAIGKLDTATIEVSRLQAEVQRLTALIPADGAADSANLDAQLDLQGATGSKGKK